jgi:hypothetical protein
MMCDKFSYRICDSVLGSSVPLPELRSAGDAPHECSFSLAQNPLPSLGSVHWYSEWPFPGGGAWLSFARTGSDYLLRFPGMADFTVSADGREIRCFPQPGIPLNTIRHLLLDQVVPLTLSSRGRLILHASAIVAPEGAIAFLGQSGLGKSTLAASFGRQGLPFLADDCLVLKEEGGRLLAFPSYPGLRLWPESLQGVFEHLPELPEVAGYSKKKRLKAHDQFPFHAEPVVLKRIYLLSPAESGIRIDPIAPRDAMAEMGKSSYVLDTENPAELKDKFQRLSSLAILPLFFRIAFPRDFSLLPRVREEILTHVNT